MKAYNHRGSKGGFEASFIKRKSFYKKTATESLDADLVCTDKRTSGGRNFFHYIVTISVEYKNIIEINGFNYIYT